MYTSTNWNQVPRAQRRTYNRLVINVLAGIKSPLAPATPDGVSGFLFPESFPQLACPIAAWAIAHGVQRFGLEIVILRVIGLSGGPLDGFTEYGV